MLTEEEKKVLKEASTELCRTAELTKDLSRNVNWIVTNYRTLVAELDGEVRDLKADVEQRDRVARELIEREGLLRSSREDIIRTKTDIELTVCGLKSDLMDANGEVDRLTSSVCLWGSLFAVSACVAFVLFMLLLKGVCG